MCCRDYNHCWLITLGWQMLLLASQSANPQYNCCEAQRLSHRHHLATKAT